MLGNVYQWVEDCYYDRYDGVPNDGSAWTSGDCKYRVARGGGWKDNPLNLRAAGRGGDPPDTQNYGTGFRVARTLSE